MIYMAMGVPNEGPKYLFKLQKKLCYVQGF
jgi:hypothetical protein